MAIVKSLEKALKVLDCFTGAETELGVSEIAEQLKLTKSNVHDILQTYVKTGCMEQDEATQKYTLSVKMLTYSNAVNRHMGYHYATHDIMEQLANKVNNIVYFSIPHGLDILYLYSAFPKEEKKKYPFRPVSGEICPMYCSSMGKAMLAFSNEKLFEQLKLKHLTRFTAETILDYEDLEKQIHLTRERGYAIDVGEHQYGVAAVGVPVFNPQGKLIGAMSICGACPSFTTDNIETYVNLLKEEAYNIQIRLR